MKTLKNALLGLSIAVLATSALLAQDAAPKSQLLYLHEDPVYPSKVAEYEKASKVFLDNAKKYKLEDSFSVIQGSDGSFTSVTAIENLAALDKDPMAAMSEGMGKDAFRAMFKDFDKCYASHRDYMLLRSVSLSYMPEGETFFPMEKPFRKYLYFYYTPENQTALGELLGKIKKLSVEKKPKMHYNIYISRLGTAENYFVVEEAAKDALEFETVSAADEKALAGVGDELMGELMKLVLRRETKTGRMRPDLSYSYTK
ncbi:hypothetical protein [Persicitalea sp.]|uniref:hypothetical protein n=1 Tax=Persicitalea sp. TaxID=3100273 RepID=UPI0035932474